MRTWYTTKPCIETTKSQISHAVADSTWGKNDHLGFQIYYLWKSGKRKFIPDFIIRLANSKLLVLESRARVPTRTGPSAWHWTPGSGPSTHAAALALGAGCD